MTTGKQENGIIEILEVIDLLVKEKDAEKRQEIAKPLAKYIEDLEH